MGIRQQEDELFKEWSRLVPDLVADGVADEATYERSDPKILLLLKEVNDPEGGGWDLRDFLRKGARQQTWDNVTRWVSAIRKLPEDVPWRALVEVPPDLRREVLQSIAAINLKKSPGGHTTEVPGFWAAVQRDVKFIAAQFALYDADLVICCGSVVADAYDVFLRPKDAGPWRATRRGIDYFERGSAKFVIAFSHPEARVASQLLHYGLVDAVRELWSNRTAADPQPC